MRAAGEGDLLPPGAASPPTSASDVAVIIPAFNAAATLPSALASIAGQTESPGTVVVVDDQSSDDTKVVAAQWTNRLPLKVISHARNEGPAAARRTAIEATTEPLIALLDSDDVWLPDHLEMMRSAFAQHGGLVTADALRWMPGRSVGRKTFRHISPIPEPDRQREEILRKNFVFVGSLFARGDYDAAGGFRDGHPGAEDWDLWIRMVRAGVLVTGTHSPTVVYRLQPGSLSHGQQHITSEISVIKLALDDTLARDERRAAEGALGVLSARLSLERAYQGAREGDFQSARRNAVRATRGPIAIALRAAAMMCLPGPSVRLRDRLFWSPRIRLGGK